MSTQIKRILRSVSSASSRASSDNRSYADTYFDEIGFKMGDNSCLGSAESPDNLEDGDQILFYKEDKLFYESEDDDDDENVKEGDVYKDEDVHHDYEDQKSADTATASNHHHPFIPPPPVGLSKEDVHSIKHGQKEIMNLPLDYVVQEHPKNKRRLNNSFGSKEDKLHQDVIYHQDDYRDSKHMEYSPNRPHPITTLGAHDNTDTKLDTGRSAKTWFFNLDTVIIGDDDFLHKSTSASVEAYKERAFRVKATIWFLFFLGTFLLVSAIVVLMLAFEQGRQAEYDRVRGNHNNGDVIDQDDAFLTPLAEGWDVDDDLNIVWTTNAPTATNPTEAPTTVAPTTASPTGSPTTIPPTGSPTEMFTTTAQEELVTTLVAASSDPNLRLGISWGSPQHQAVVWLADDPFLAGYSDNRILQRWAVATFYFSTKGDIWNVVGDDNQAIAIARQRDQQQQQQLNPWMIPTTNECWWFSSHDKQDICDKQGRLEVLSLNGIGLQGSLPPELGFLTMLKEISLPNNEIEGRIPSTLGRLTLLESLDLQHNQISQGLPRELGGLEALKEFRANDNQLEGSIPIEFFSMLDLKTLHLESNKISGEIPTALAALPFLKELTIQNNQVIGTMPFETCHLDHLIADCDEMICECCTQCCIGCQGSIEQIVDTVPTLGPTPTQTKAPTKAPTRTPTAAPTRTPVTAQPTTRRPTSPPTSNPTRTPTAAPTRTPTTTGPTTRKPTSPPTSRPTRTPTGAPTRIPTAPTRKPTNPPTGPPTRSPTKQPIGPPPEGIHILVSVGNDGLPEQLYPLKMCQGDCDTNTECEGDLVCYERVGLERVPGCLGQGVANRDYCTHPHFIAEAEAGGGGNADADDGAKPGFNDVDAGAKPDFNV